MQVRRFFVFSRLALLWAGACVHAQTTLTIDDAVRTALQNHPLLQERQQRSEVANGFALQAGLRPNPRLITQSENWSLTGAPPQSIPTFTDQFLYLSQVFETGAKRDRRVDLGRTGKLHDLLALMAAAVDRAHPLRTTGDLKAFFKEHVCR